MLPPDDLEKANGPDIALEQPKMLRREITLADGRYLYFYTFTCDADPLEQVERRDVRLEEK